MQTEQLCEVVGNSVVITSKTNFSNRVRLTFSCSDDFEISVGESKPLATSPSPEGLKDTSHITRIMLKMTADGDASITAKLSPEAIDSKDATSHDADISTWEISEDAWDDADGKIPEEFLSSATYPFAVFDANGTFCGGYRIWGSHSDSANSAFPNCPVGGTVLLRRDFEAYDTKHMNYSNLGWLTEGTRTMDLGGFNFDITRHNEGSLIKFEEKSSDREYTLIIKNGSITYGRNAVASLHMHYGTNPKINFVFENVRFIYSDEALAGGTSGELFAYSEGYSGSGTIFADVVFDDCTFDIKEFKNDGCLFELGTHDDVIHTKITVKGGEIIASHLTKADLLSVNNKASSIRFVPDSLGKKTLLTFAKENVLWNEPMHTNNGYALLTHILDDETGSRYELSNPQNPILCKSDSNIYACGIQNDCLLIIAAYTNENEMTDLKFYNMISEDTKIDIGDYSDNSSQIVKVFLWNKDLVPYSTMALHKK